ncbi:TetR/AcrR family transcriptional regulator [Halobacillus litoralis]|uniref:TetR/AcrR family transcriptional regulator n=1 Tax=Halobacillus litoralis TaxID=45668 RepID=UPI001CD57D55|nr:TetR family transcriptional regulator [Halobacillus litoralis]MCA0970534.1 TetR/AcrR family transcriptional regulator [Halobacillus litoralis]
MAIQKSEEKRQKILQAAIQLFSENGYSKATIKDISKEAGVSFGTVFTYYETKDKLFEAAVLEPLEEMKQVLLSHAEDQEDIIDQIKETIRMHMMYFARQATYARMVQYVIGQRERFPELFDELNAFTEDLQDSLKPLVEKGQEAGVLIKLDPKNVAITYLAYINGVRLTTIDDIDQVPAWNMFVDHAFLLFGPKQ